MSKVPLFTAPQLRALGQLTQGPRRIDGQGGYGEGRAYTPRHTVSCLRTRGLIGVLAMADGHAAVLTPRGREALGISEVRL